MFPQIEVKHNIGNTISIPNQLDVRAGTFSNDNIAIGVTAIPVDNALDFTAGAILLLVGTMGNESSEISASSAHTGQSFTVAATTQPHSRGESVQELHYDQVSIFKSATIDGSYLLLQTLTLQVKQQNTIAFDATGLTTTYYKVQWKNSQTAAVSSFSDPISVEDYPEDSVANLIFPVLRAMGVSKDDPKINAEFCISAIDDARKYTHGILFGIRQAWQQKFQHPIKMLAGANFVYLPDDIQFSESDRSILAARFLTNSVLSPYNLRYVDKRYWNNISYALSGSKVAVQAGIGATFLVLENTGDFPDAGELQVATSDFDQTILTIEYTANDPITGTLTGVTLIDRILPVGLQIWIRPNTYQPSNYTVYEDMIVFDATIPDSMQGNNVYVDYYAKISFVTTLYQSLPEPYREIYKWYLRYAIKYRKDISLGSDDPDLVKFEGLVKALFANLYTGQATRIETA